MRRVRAANRPRHALRASRDTPQIDTARVYCGGTSEQILGKIDLKKRGIVVETKLAPNTVRCACMHSGLGPELTGAFA